ncbi:protein kinase [Nostoc punctiforme NIES-2108]|uniref:non-specific serine/threonine protein kinase n=1 Tax=Nostoc punctiforme NIES-2108 TaxID=1356359 RepID=A0A367QZA8_NOSPU|nr:protein kinase [Nostoc punctiforme NIES-2108]
MVAKVIPIGQPVNDSERQAIKFLRDNLLDTYIIIHNFEITQGKEKYEIDLAIIAPHSIFIVDVKGIPGLIDIYNSKWYPQGRDHIGAPLAKCRQNAKVIKALICDAHPTKTNLKQIHVHAAILMTAPNSHVEAHGNSDEDDITYLNQKCLTYFKGKGHIPSHRSQDIRSFHTNIEQAIVGKARPKSAPTIYREWQIEEELGGTPDKYTEYRAKHSFLGKRGGIARLRVYEVDPYQEHSIRDRQRNLISNAYRSMVQMPGHPNILKLTEFFPTEAEDKFILVIEDIAGEPLSQHIRKSNLALTFDQKIGIIRDILSALDHAHKYEVIHRNLTVDAILVTPDGNARLTAFDYARVTKNRSSTIAGDIVDELDYNYQAPECYRDPTEASIASDLFSAGLVFYELLTGQTAFENISQIFDCDAIFPEKPSSYKPDLPAGIDEWLQKLCAFDVEDRFISAAVTLMELNNVITPKSPVLPLTPNTGENPKSLAEIDLRDLPAEYLLGNQFIIQKRLGQGGFGVAYKVFDSMGDRDLVMKLITRDKQSIYQRLVREYKTLLNIPEHPYIVKVIFASKFPDDTPYILFDYIDGEDVEKLLETEALSLEDTIKIALQTVAGLAHLHENGVYHQDIKPSNLLLTDKGVRIIDFNVAVSERDESMTGGGTRAYIPPDFDLTLDLDQIDQGQKSDRDLYALGITFYECITGKYPFDDRDPKLRRDKLPYDPRNFTASKDLSDELAQFLMKAISPYRVDRFSSAKEFGEALDIIKHPRKISQPTQLTTESLPSTLTDTSKPNFNPFVSHLLTLYSQSQQTNAGTRGLDKIGKLTYVPTLLDQALQPAILAGEFSLVMISGNAGDGKTAFIQQLENYAKDKENVQLKRGLNGSEFQIRGRTFLTNYDGSQDEGDKVNNEVLLEFLAPFQGSNTKTWQTNETRLIAINEGRLVDFLSEHERIFPKLAKIVKNGIKGADPENGIAVINLNIRSVVADLGQENHSIFDRLIRRMTEPRFWEACGSCDLKERCYIYHNARTFMDGTASPKVIERLKTLYTITHLRGRLHITLRDLRSALAFMLAGTRDCDGVHELYRQSTLEARQHILDGFYFNSWMGGMGGSGDRLISLLQEIDVGETSNPSLDRSFAFLEPGAKEMGRFNFSDRSCNDDHLLQKTFEELPRDYRGKIEDNRQKAYKKYIAMLRRRQYFERRDSGWQEMLPYSYFKDFLKLVTEEEDLAKEVQPLLRAINRGEGLRNPSRLGNKLALRVHQVNNGTIRSYRVFDSNSFGIKLGESGGITRFIEFLPQAFYLQYHFLMRHDAELSINLDVYEMLKRLDAGYRPSIEEQQGLYRSLAVFKNILASAPYQEVLLTETGQDFYSISRDEVGNLSLTQVQEGI